MRPDLRLVSNRDKPEPVAEIQMFAFVDGMVGVFVLHNGKIIPIGEALQAVTDFVERARARRPVRSAVPGAEARDNQDASTPRGLL
jgi:hypothetical protein